MSTQHNPPGQWPPCGWFVDARLDDLVPGIIVAMDDGAQLELDACVLWDGQGVGTGDDPGHTMWVDWEYLALSRDGRFAVVWVAESAMGTPNNPAPDWLANVPGWPAHPHGKWVAASAAWEWFTERAAA